MYPPLAYIGHYPLNEEQIQALHAFLLSGEDFPQSVEDYTGADKTPTATLSCHTTLWDWVSSSSAHRCVILDFSGPASYNEIPIRALTRLLIAGSTWSDDEIMGHLTECVTKIYDEYIDVGSLYFYLSVIRRFHLMMKQLNDARNVNHTKPFRISSVMFPWHNEDNDFDDLEYSANLFAMSAYVVYLSTNA